MMVFKVLAVWEAAYWPYLGSASCCNAYMRREVLVPTSAVCEAPWLRGSGEPNSREFSGGLFRAEELLTSGWLAGLPRVGLIG